MKCELCHQHEAETVIFREGRGKRREELYVCQDCAKREEAFNQERGIQVTAMEFAEDSFRPAPPEVQGPEADDAGEAQPPPPEAFHALGKMFNQLSSRLSGEKGEENSLRCPACGLEAGEIAASGLMGCPKCYEFFREAILPLLAEINDCTAFGGSFGVAQKPSAREQLKALQAALAEAVKREDYAAAKQLKAQIDALKRALDDAAQGGNHGA